MNELLTSTFVVNIIPSIAGILLAICYTPQLIRTFKTKNVESFSLKFWIILDIALLCFVINALSLLALGSGSYGYLFAELLNLTMSMALTIMIIKYRK